MSQKTTTFQRGRAALQGIPVCDQSALGPDNPGLTLLEKAPHPLHPKQPLVIRDILPFFTFVVMSKCNLTRVLVSLGVPASRNTQSPFILLQFPL